MLIKTESINVENGILVTIVSENIDAGNVAEFKTKIHSHLENNELVIVDMSELKFVDSSGLGAMLSCLRIMNDKKGALRLIKLNKPVIALFELVRMNRIFSIYENLDQALVTE
jgi:anti-sigma B factor antagonist